MKKRVFLFLVLFSFSFLCFSQNNENKLFIGIKDIELVPEFNEEKKVIAYHLFVKKTESINSILLTETTRDDSGIANNYAYRAKEYNKINGDEVRILDGKILDSKYSKYSLVDSTEESHKKLGKAFHIYIPLVIEYGYPWSRNGSVRIGKGTFINIRAFSKQFADYTGEFYDNPFMFDLDKVSKDILTDEYNPVASQRFNEISDFMIYSKGPETIVSDIMTSLKKVTPKDNVDVVFVIDSTGSMKDDVETLRKEWIPKLIEELKEFNQIRLGLILYRDYGDSYKYNNLPIRFFNFTNDVKVFTKNLNSFTILGTEGGDIPEAVYEGLYAALSFYKWNEEAQKKIILIGDAEPHPEPRGTKKYTKELVMQLSKEKNIVIDAIITPDEKGLRGR